MTATLGVPTATGVLQGRAAVCAVPTSVAVAATNSNLGTSALPSTRPLLKPSLARASSQLTLGCLETPGLFLPTVHKPQAPPLVGSGPDFGDSVTLDVPSTLPGEPATASSCPKLRV